MAEERPVLVVEDDPDIGEALADVIREAGYPVVVCADGRAALDYIETHPPPGLILLDLIMPRMDGRAFLDALGPERRRQIPVVLLTAVDPGARRGAAEPMPALAKPARLEEILRVTARHYERAGAHAALRAGRAPVPGPPPGHGPRARRGRPGAGRRGGA